MDLFLCRIWYAVRKKTENRAALLGREMVTMETGPNEAFVEVSSGDVKRRCF